MRYYESDVAEKLGRALVELLSSEELKKLAKLTDSRPPTRKAEIAKHIVRYLSGDGLRRVFESMEELQRAAVAEVVHSDQTVFDELRFVAKYGRHPEDGQKNTYARLAEPTALGFFFVGQERLMPLEVKERLKAFVPPPPPVRIDTVEEPPAHYERRYRWWDEVARKAKSETELVPVLVHESERRAQRELASVLRLIDSGKVAVSDKTRKPTKAGIEAILSVLEGGDFYPNDQPKRNYSDPNPGPIRAFAWPMIVQAGKLAQLSGRRLQLTDAGRRTLSSLFADDIRSLWEKWTRTTLIDELSRIDSVKGQTGKARRSITSVAGRRDTIGTVLSECPENRWIHIDELIRIMRAGGHDFSVARNAWGLYVGHPEHGSLGYAGCDMILEEAYLRGFLLEYAATLGLIDVALVPPTAVSARFEDQWGVDELPYFSRYDGLEYLRINPLGAYCLRMSEDYSPAAIEPANLLRVLPNFEIVVTADILPQADRLALDTYFEQVSDLVWRVDRTGLLSSVAGGSSIEEIREYLKARSETPVPETIEQLLNDVEERSDRLRDLGTARIVECDEAALAHLIANDTSTRNHCMLAGDRHIVVPTRSESAFRRGVQELGFLVRPKE